MLKNMDGFETISLESTECDICHQDTGEELISCVLNDRYLRESENLKTSCSGNVAKAHEKCLEKWESVVKTAIKPIVQVKRTWKDRLKGFVNTAPDRGDSIETWAPIKRYGDSVDERIGCQDTSTSRFSTNEAYRVESLCKDENRTRGRKVRIKSIEIEDDDESGTSKSNTTHEKLEDRSSTKAKQSRDHLLGLDVAELRNIVSGLQAEINEVSTDLVNQLQERDTLIQQGDTMRVTVGQLINLQANVKNASTLSISGTTRTSQMGPVIL